MYGTDFQQGEKVMQRRVVVAFDHRVHGVVKKLSALHEVQLHFSFKVGFRIAELFGEFFQVFIKEIDFRTLPEVHGVQRIGLKIPEGEFDMAVPGQILKVVRHVEKAGTGIKGEPVFFQLTKKPSGLAVLFNDGYRITIPCQPHRRGMTAQPGTHNQNTLCQFQFSVLIII